MSTVKLPSIRDVSTLAGVSATTVSRVLNNSDIPSPETRQRVMQAVDQLGYRFDPLHSLAARRDRQGLRGAPIQRSNIGYLANLRYFANANRSDGYYSAVASGIETAIRENHYHLMLEGIEWGQRTLPDCVSDDRVDALIIEGTIDPSLRELLVARLPTIFIDRMYPELNCGCVYPNWVQSIERQMEYLWDLGHRNIVILWHEDADYQQIVSLRAFHEFFASRHTPLAHPELCKPRSMRQADAAMAAYAQELVHAPHRPTALIGPNAYVIHILRHLQQAGLHVPADISVIGTNDQFNGQLTSPALTSWVMSMEEVGRSAVEMLLQQLKEPTRPYRRICVDGHRIERASCASPRQIQPGSVRS